MMSDPFATSPESEPNPAEVVEPAFDGGPDAVPAEPEGDPFAVPADLHILNEPNPERAAAEIAERGEQLSAEERVVAAAKATADYEAENEESLRRESAEQEG